jgi:hypothetical protein
MHLRKKKQKNRHKVTYQQLATAGYRHHSQSADVQVLAFLQEGFSKQLTREACITQNKSLSKNKKLLLIHVKFIHLS